MRAALFTLMLALTLPAVTAPAHAIVMDGHLDPEYGTPIAVQTTQTTANDATSGRIGATNGGEIDAAHAFVADNTLHLFVTGNLWFEGNPVDYGAFYTVLHVFVDTGASGQNAVAGLSDFTLGWLNGLTFDAGVAPSHLFTCVGSLANYYDPSSTYTLAAYHSTLAAGGGAASTRLGITGAGGPGTLADGTNPDGVELAIDNSNVAGVAAGCDAASGAGVTTGIEWAIPLAALGNPAGCLGVSVVMTRGYASLCQTLGPLPPDGCASLGPVGQANFATIAGEQFFRICPPGVPVRTSTWGALKSIYR